jgi:hypothetical protein
MNATHPVQNKQIIGAISTVRRLESAHMRSAFGVSHAGEIEMNSKAAAPGPWEDSFVLQYLLCDGRRNRARHPKLGELRKNPPNAMTSQGIDTTGHVTEFATV